MGRMEPVFPGEIVICWPQVAGCCWLPHVCFILPSHTQLCHSHAVATTAKTTPTLATCIALPIAYLGPKPVARSSSTRDATAKSLEQGKPMQIAFLRGESHRC